MGAAYSAMPTAVATAPSTPARSVRARRPRRRKAANSAIASAIAASAPSDRAMPPSTRASVTMWSASAARAKPKTRSWPLVRRRRALRPSIIASALRSPARLDKGLMSPRFSGTWTRDERLYSQLLSRRMALSPAASTTRLLQELVPVKDVQVFDGADSPCPFYITFTGTWTIRVTSYYDKGGAPIRQTVLDQSRIGHPKSFTAPSLAYSRWRWRRRQPWPSITNDRDCEDPQHDEGRRDDSKECPLRGRRAVVVREPQSNGRRDKRSAATSGRRSLALLPRC